jgi:hypothetical protein
MRRALCLAVSALALALAIAAPVAAQTGQDQMDPKAMEALMMQLMTPGVPHQHLSDLAGKWTTTQTMYMEATPQSSTGEAEYEMALGGRYLVGRYKSTYMGQPFEGMSIDGYDNGKAQYFSIWLDSMGTGYYLAHGTASPDGKVFKLSGTMVMGPMEIPSRSESVMVDKDTMQFTMWHTMGDQEMKAMEMTYTRVK